MPTASPPAFPPAFISSRDPDTTGLLVTLKLRSVCATAPFSSRTARLAWAATHGICVTRTTVRPRSRSPQKHAFQTNVAVLASSAEKTTSSTSSGALE